MRAVLVRQPGGIEELYIGEVETPVPKDDQLLVKIHATALNRADLLQRRGLYPPPKGESEILGLEMAGEVVQVGSACGNWKIGDRVCGLLPGGGYAEYAVIPAKMAIPIPETLDFEQAAAIPEVFLTAFLNLRMLGQFKEGQTALIHAGASGVGTAAIQLVKEMGGRSIVTASSQKKLDVCKSLGASYAISYKEGSFAPKVMEITQGKGVDLIFDFIGAPYWEQNIQCLGFDGKLVIIGTMGGAKVANVDLGVLLRKRIQVIGTALRSRPVADKMKLTESLVEFAYPRFTDGRLRPVIDRVFPLEKVAEAHRYMEQNQNIGKIILKV
jgi:tumor protein p53-inducible protein 3